MGKQHNELKCNPIPKHDLGNCLYLRQLESFGCTKRLRESQGSINKWRWGQWADLSRTWYLSMPDFSITCHSVVTGEPKLAVTWSVSDSKSLIGSIFHSISLALIKGKKSIEHVSSILSELVRTQEMGSPVQFWAYTNRYCNPSV